MNDIIKGTRRAFKHILETERAIKSIKDHFQTELANKLGLIRVSAPLFVKSNSGINDSLNGVERPVSFDIPFINTEVQVVQSLAKWKRMALYNYGFQVGEGLYTDMNAIRRDENLDNIHSVYVDQWDWEKIIRREDRTMETLQKTVSDIYEVFLSTADHVASLYPKYINKLPKEIFFITSQELEDMYPTKTPKEREDIIAHEKKAVFISQIGKTLKSGQKHDGRAPDYDDWELNGDILFWNQNLSQALELSSMGIRVDSESLDRQLRLAGADDRRENLFHQKLLNDELPFTIGGGIGQSRMCMFFLHKHHIGEVQASIWPKDVREALARDGIYLL
ncbi:MAG: aspartate--ammonia ligase [Bacillota bacterium]|nr:aspartate--ammonia ligase [Bacillota bacterium]